MGLLWMIKGSIAYARALISHLVHIYQNDLFDMHMVPKSSFTLYIWATKIILLNVIR